MRTFFAKISRNKKLVCKAQLQHLNPFSFTSIPLLPSFRDPKDTTPVDVLVCGAGPAGLAVAGRVASAGLTVALVDPEPLLNFIPTYGVWIDEFKAMGFEDVFEYTWQEAEVHLESGPDGKPVVK